MFNKYIPVKLFPKQMAFCMLPHQEALYGGQAGGGKAGMLLTSCNAAVLGYNPENPSDMENFRMRFGQYVITPFGPKLIDDVKVGDQVCNPDGTVCHVIAEHYQKDRQCYRVTFIDGSSCAVDAGHIWSVKTSGVRTRSKVEDPYDLDIIDTPEHRFNAELVKRYKNVTTETLFHLHKKAEKQQEEGKRPLWLSVPLCNPVNFQMPKGKAAIIDGYLLGIWLGDGWVSNGSVLYHKPDKSIHAEVNRIAAEYGDSLVPLPSNPNTYIYHGKTLTNALRSFKLDGCKADTKFIPRYYLHAPTETRLSLLQGLMDSDGTADDRGHCSYCTISERLALDVQYLARSLGYNATIGTKDEPKYTYNGEVRIGQKAYVIYITGRDRTSLFRKHESKTANVKDINNEGGKRIVRVAKIKGSFETKCITVSHPNNLYMTNDFIVTHNSECLLAMALQYIHIPGYSAIIFRKTLTDLKQPQALLDRAHSWLRGKPGVKFAGDEHTYYFDTTGPDGRPANPSRIAFGYIGDANVYTRYQSAEYQCVAKGTRVLMGDGSYLPIEEIKVGYRVMTLNGPKAVTRTFPSMRKQGVRLGNQIQGDTHAVLTRHGEWVIPSPSEPIECCVWSKSLCCGRGTFWYRHPYNTSNLRKTKIDPYTNTFVPEPVGDVEVYDITVEDENHFITESGLINKNCVLWDELTQHEEVNYLYLFSRLRKKSCPIHKSDDKGAPIYVDGCWWCNAYKSLPLKVRSATNPGGIGHQWVRDRFQIEPAEDIPLYEIREDDTSIHWVGRQADKPFIQASYRDNPFIDQESYANALDQLPAIERARLKYGNWAVNVDARFSRRWVRYYSSRGDSYFSLGRDGRGPIVEYPQDIQRTFVTVDPAASLREGQAEAVTTKRDASWTVISVWALTTDFHLLLLDVVRFQDEIPQVVKELVRVNKRWKPDYFRIEGNGLGKGVVQYAQIYGLTVKEGKRYTDKVVNSTAAQLRMEQGRIWFPQQAPWLKKWEDEIFNWTGDPTQPDDQVDTLSDAAQDIVWEAGDDRDESERGSPTIIEAPGFYSWHDL